MNRLKSQLHFLHVLKDTKPQARRASLAPASKDLEKAIVECAINTMNGNHKLTKEEKNKLSKDENHLRASVNPKISFKSKCKLLIQKGGFIVPLLTSILSGGTGALMNNNKKWYCQRMILVPPELCENHCQSPPPVKKILKSKDHSSNKWTKFVCIKTHT